MGRALDVIYAYGPEALYGQLAAQAVKRLGLSCQIGHIDSTSFHVDGLYNSNQEASERVIHITQGFLKSPKRIMALMMIMTLCLLVFDALEYRIRQTLQQHQQTFPTQLGATTAKPTARWVFQFFAGIHVLLNDY